MLTKGKYGEWLLACNFCCLDRYELAHTSLVVAGNSAICLPCARIAVETATADAAPQVDGSGEVA